MRGCISPAGWRARCATPKASRRCCSATSAFRCRLEHWVGHWMALPADERTRLGRGEAQRSLGCGAVLGRRVWDRQHKFRFIIGPLTLARYREFLPGAARPRAAALVQQLLGDELDWDARADPARRTKVPPTRLGQPTATRRGWAGSRGSASRTAHARTPPTCASTRTSSRARPRINPLDERHADSSSPPHGEAHERNQPRRPVRQAQPAGLQGHRRRHRLLQAARQPVRRAGALARADPADAGLRPAPHRPALRARRLGAGRAT